MESRIEMINELVLSFTNKWLVSKTRVVFCALVFLVALFATGWLWYQLYESITSVAMCADDTPWHATPKRFEVFNADGSPRTVSAKSCEGKGLAKYYDQGYDKGYNKGISVAYDKVLVGAIFVSGVAIIAAGAYYAWKWLSGT